MNLGRTSLTNLWSPCRRPLPRSGVTVVCLCVCVCVCCNSNCVLPSTSGCFLLLNMHHASMLTGSNHFYHERAEMQMAPQCWYQSHPLDFPESAVVCTNKGHAEAKSLQPPQTATVQCARYSKAVKPRKRAPSAWFLPCVGQGRWQYWPAGLSLASSVAVHFQNLQSSLFGASPLRHWSAESLHPSHIGRRTGTTRSASEFAVEYNTSLKSRLSICFHSLIESCFFVSMIGLNSDSETPAWIRCQMCSLSSVEPAKSPQSPESNCSNSCC